MTTQFPDCYYSEGRSKDLFATIQKTHVDGEVVFFHRFFYESTIPLNSWILKKLTRGKKQKKKNTYKIRVKKMIEPRRTTFFVSISNWYLPNRSLAPPLTERCPGIFIRISLNYKVFNELESLYIESINGNVENSVSLANFYISFLWTILSFNLFITNCGIINFYFSGGTSIPNTNVFEG